MFRKDKKTLESELSKIINLEANFGQWLLSKLAELEFDPNSLSIYYSLDSELQKGAISDGTKIFAWEKDWRISTNGDRKDVYWTYNLYPNTRSSQDDFMRVNS